jgi:hypothetical protein
MLVFAQGCKTFNSRTIENKHDSGFIEVSTNNAGFIFADSGKPFVPIGFNYDRDYKSRLIEEYWNAEWQTVVGDFREMKRLGATVVRVHLQFAKFMDAPDKPNQKSLAQLNRLVRLAEKTGLHLDLTGLACYRKSDVPPWFDSLSEKDRWNAQANFWSAIAKTCANSPAIFCYDLMNEPVFPSGKLNRWLLGEFGGFSYVQAVTLNSNNRTRAEIAHEWISKLSGAIRQHDKKHLITVGLLPMEPRDFVRDISRDLDFIAVHIYPHSGKLADDLETLKHFSVGKPVVVEEMFPMNCTPEELREFVEKSRGTASGWIGFYWGQTPEELSRGKTFLDVVTREWLKVFEQIRQGVLP